MSTERPIRPARELEQLTAQLYDELRVLAGGMLRHERRDHTLQATALVHEAWLKLAEQSKLVLESRAKFLALSATVIRRVLLDHARARGAQKRGEARLRVELDDELAITPASPLDVIELDDLLERYAELDPRAARVAELRVFGGMTVPEIAEAIDVSARTVDEEWKMARAWLAVRLERERLK